MDIQRNVDLSLNSRLKEFDSMSNTQQYGEICGFGIRILSFLINPSSINNDAMSRIFSLYKKIRKIAYLSVDMIYTPASFGENLNRMTITMTMMMRLNTNLVK